MTNSCFSFKAFGLSCLLTLTVFLAIAQTKDNPKVYFLNHLRKTVGPDQGFSYFEAVWLDVDKVHAQLYSNPEKKLVADYYYSDTSRNFKEGVYMSFHANGSMDDSGYYKQNKLHGPFFSWYDDGGQAMKWQYNMGRRTDTCISWNKEGIMSEISVTDSSGNGICQLFYANGKLKESGRLVNGLRSGKWMVKNEDGSPLMELQFANDSLSQTVCLDINGAPVQGECVYERVPEFPGGVEGWRRFLEAKLRYPEDAIRNNIQGVVKVKFVVEKDGALSNMEIMSSPDESLSREVIRLMKSGPKWVPAIQYNKPVKYYHIQAVTFRLQ